MEYVNHERKVKEIYACAEARQDIYTGFWRIINLSDNKVLSDWHMFNCDCWKEAYDFLLKYKTNID